MQILFWVSKGSTLEPLLFNIFLCNLFVIMNKADFASYADGRTPYTIGNEIEDVMQRLHTTSKFIFFSISQTKKWRLINVGKCHFICSFYQKTELIENEEIPIEIEQTIKVQTFWVLKLTRNSYFARTYRGKGFLINIVWFGAYRKY